MAEQVHVFLSYRSVEVNFALRLGADLKNAGVTVWMDRFDINPTEDWKRELQQNLIQSAAIIPILSPAYVTSIYCRNELARMSRMGRPIIPVLLYPLASEDWPSEIEQDYVDFSLSQDELFYQNQLGKLIDILQEQVGPIWTNTAPEIQCANRLIAHLEASKGILNLFETSPTYEAALPVADIRPQAVLGHTWHLHGRYVVTDDSVGLENEIGRSIKQSVQLNSIYDAVDDYPQFILVSPPGFGKSLTLQSLALDAARQFQASPMTTPLPLLIKLHQWEDDSSPVDLVRSYWPLTSDPIELLARGRVSLYLDGLSEIPGDADRKVEMLRDWLNSSFAPQRLIITCRTDDYDKGVQLDLPVVQAVELDGTFIERFVEYYLEEDEAKYFLDHIIGAEGKDSRSANLMHSMARNPFLLAALVLMYRISPERDTAHSTGQIIRQLAKNLWARRVMQDMLDDLEYEEIEAALINLAFEMVDTDAGIYIPHDKAVKNMGNQLLLQTALEAHLLESDNGEIRFPHELLKQYFAALGLQATGLPTRLTRPQFDPTFQRIPRKWDQTIMMLVGIMPNPDAVILNIAEVDPYLALQCIFCGAHLEERTYKTVIKHQLDLMKTEGDFRVAMAQILIGADNQKATLILLEALRDGAWTVRQAAAAALGRIPVVPIPALTEALNNMDDTNRAETLAAVCLLGVEAVPVLIDLLQAPDWHTRQGAAWALGELKERAAVPFLLQSLEDSDHGVNAAAALALGMIRDKIAIPNLVRAMGHIHWRVNKAAARSLAYIGDAAMPDLVEVLKNKNTPAGQRVRAIEALAYVRKPEAGAILLRLSHSRNIDERYSAVKALKYHLDSASIKRLTECLTDEGKPRWSAQRVCDVAATILETVGTKETSAVVEKWRGRQVRNARSTTKEPSGKTVKERLRRVVHPTAVVDTGTFPIQGTDDDDWVVRRDSATALAGEPAAVAIPRLIASLKDEDSQVRIAAIRTLAKFPDDERVIPRLVGALSDEEYLVCDAARDALKIIGKAPMPGLMEAVRSSNLNLRAAAIDVAGAIGEQDAIPDMIESLMDKRTLWLSDQRICDIAAQALISIGTPTALEAADQWRRSQENPVRQPIPSVEPDVQERDIVGELLEELRSKEWTARQEAAKALREYAQFSRGVSDSLLVKPLTNALNDVEWSVRLAACEALAWIRDTAPVPAVAVLVKDSNWMVRSAAVRALMEIGDPTCLDSVIQALRDENAMVREAAAEALGKLGDLRAIPALVAGINDSEQLVQIAAIDALGNLKDPFAIDALRRLLSEGNNVIRWYTVEAMRKIAHPSSAAVLIPLLEDTSCPPWEDKPLCEVAASALEAINTPEARAALEIWKNAAPVR